MGRQADQGERLEEVADLARGRTVGGVWGAGTDAIFANMEPEQECTTISGAISPRRSFGLSVSTLKAELLRRTGQVDKVIVQTAAADGNPISLS